MRVLYRDYVDKTLTVAEVTGTLYFSDEEALQFIGSDRDFAVKADRPTAEKLVRSLYLEDRLDVSSYESCDVDLLEDEMDDEDFEDMDDEDDLLDIFLSDEDTSSFRIPRTIPFPRKPRT